MTWTLISVFVALVAAGAIYVRAGHAQLAPVLSGSMRPGIHEGDVVVTHQVDVNTLRVGDIVVFHPPGYTTARVHRIIWLRHTGNDKVEFRTKGDYNKVADPWGTVSLAGKAYKVVFVIPKIGWLTNGGLRWVIAAFTLLFAAIITRWVIRYVRSEGPATKGEQE